MGTDTQRSAMASMKAKIMSTLQTQVFDRLMYSFFLKNNVVYNIAWEDPRVDRELVNMGPGDKILMLTSGGCNVLDYLLEGCDRIVAADLNPNQNAVLELKLVCIRHLEYEQFFSLFALRGQRKLFEQVYASKLRTHLSPTAQAFWDKNASF